MGVPWKCTAPKHSKVFVQHCEEHAIPNMMRAVLHQCTGHRRSIVCWQHDAGQGHQASLIGVPYKCTGPQHIVVCGNAAKKRATRNCGLVCHIHAQARAQHCICLQQCQEKNATRPCRLVCHIRAPAPSTALWMLATWRRKRPPVFFGLACQSMHRSSAQHCVCWPHGE